MTNKALLQDTHKDFGINNAENVLNRFADRSEICKEYGQDHTFVPSFDDVTELLIGTICESRDSFN